MLIVHGNRRARAEARRTRTRRLYEAQATVSGTTITLKPRRGAWLTQIDATGEVLLDGVRDASCALFANLGDRLIVAGPTIAETAMVEVTGINPSNLELTAQMLCGELAETTEKVFVLPATKARAERRRT